MKAQLYYEVFCPGCSHLILTEISRLRDIGDIWDITDMEFIPYGNAKIITRDPPTFECQHGEEECYGNMVELCAIKHNPDNWWDFILCEEGDPDFSDEGIRKCAKVGYVDGEEILTCSHGTEGPLLHLEAGDNTPEHKYVPWLLVDGKLMGSGDSLKRMICDAYTGEKPAACKQ